MAAFTSTLTLEWAVGLPPCAPPDPVVAAPNTGPGAVSGTNLVDILVVGHDNKYECESGHLNKYTRTKTINFRTGVITYGPWVLEACISTCSACVVDPPPPPPGPCDPNVDHGYGQQGWFMTGGIWVADGIYECLPGGIPNYPNFDSPEGTHTTTYCCPACSTSSCSNITGPCTPTQIRFQAAISNSTHCSSCSHLADVLLNQVSACKWSATVTMCSDGTITDFVITFSASAGAQAVVIGGPWGTSVGWSRTASWDGAATITLSASLTDLGNACIFPSTVTITPI